MEGHLKEATVMAKDQDTGCPSAGAGREEQITGRGRGCSGHGSRGRSFASPSGTPTSSSSPTMPLGTRSWPPPPPRSSASSGGPRRPETCPRAYLTGYLAGKRAAKNGIEDAVLDIGLRGPAKGSAVFAALKGMIDAGIEIPHGEEVLPSQGKAQRCPHRREA